MKKKFVLRLNQSEYDAIERWATDEFRSVNGQIEWMLHKMLAEAGRLKKERPETKQSSDESSDQDKN